MCKLCVLAPKRHISQLSRVLIFLKTSRPAAFLGELPVGLAEFDRALACTKRVTKEPGTAQKLPWKGRSKGTGEIESRKPEVARVGTARATSLMAKKSVSAR